MLVYVAPFQNVEISLIPSWFESLKDEEEKCQDDEIKLPKKIPLKFDFGAEKNVGAVSE